MEKYFEILKNCPLFSGISEEGIAAVLGCLGAQPMAYPKKSTVFSEGTHAAHIGILLSGALQITQLDYFGNRSIVGNVEPGDIFAESFAAANVAEIPVDVVAASDSAVLLIHRDRILHPCGKACSFHMEIIYNLMHALAEKNLAFHQRLDIISKRTTREKLMAYLTARAKSCASQEFDIPFDRQELADYLLVDRSGLSSEIGRLVRDGVLSCCRSHFKLL